MKLNRVSSIKIFRLFREGMCVCKHLPSLLWGQCIFPYWYGCYLNAPKTKILLVTGIFFGLALLSKALSLFLIPLFIFFFLFSSCGGKFSNHEKDRDSGPNPYWSIFRVYLRDLSRRAGGLIFDGLK